jgi:twinkle protein
MASKELLSGEVEALTARGIKIETAKFFDYRLGKLGKKAVQIANYKDPAGTAVVAQKVRDRDKNFIVRGDLSKAGLYGQWLWRDQGKMVVVTEGEIDALTVSQLQDNKWPVVSIPSGAPSARKALSAQLKWLLGFETIVLMFDDDEPGRAAVEECAPLFPPGRVKVARIAGFKDANEALLAGKPKAVIDAIWGAKDHRPDGIVSVADVKDKATAALVRGSAWPWPRLTELTLGLRPGEVIMIGAGTGIGKSEVFDQIIAHVVSAEGKPAAVFKFEQPVGETVRRVAGKIAGRKFHLPDAGWTQGELEAVVNNLADDNKLYLYDHFGQCDWDVVVDHIRYLVAAHGVRDVFIDHLTALADTGDSERGSIEEIMKQAATLAQELEIKLYMISHLSTPDGTPHEEGGRVMIRHFKGSRAIGFWSHIILGLERDQQHENPAMRSITTVRVLKNRYAGPVGDIFFLGYDSNTGILAETELPEDEEEQVKGTGFKKERKSSSASEKPF